MIYVVWLLISVKSFLETGIYVALKAKTLKETGILPGGPGI